MAIITSKGTMYEGAVLKIREHMWMDGMLEVFAVVWDMEQHDTKEIQVGYYGIDGNNLCDATAEVDISKEVARDVCRTLKRKAAKAFADSVINAKNAVKSGRNVEVIRGRKIPKGTHLNVFWVGERPTYTARYNSWDKSTERIAGCFNDKGEKVWIKAEYLKVIDEIKSPDANERKRFIKEWVKEQAWRLNIKYAC